MLELCMIGEVRMIGGVSIASRDRWELAVEIDRRCESVKSNMVNSRVSCRSSELTSKRLCDG